MAELLNVESLKTLLKEHGQPCVSIFMPTHRKGKEVEQDPIRFKNLLHEATKSALDQGFRLSEVKELMEPAERLLADSYNWRHQDAGLAVFLAPQKFHFYRLPVEVEELALVSHRFHIKPLIPLVSLDGHFFILALSQKYPRLFHGSRYRLDEVELKEIVPQSLEEALRFDEPEKQTQFHTETAEIKGGRRAAIFHTQGGDTDTARHKKDILRYFQMIDRGLQRILGPEHSPLVIAGVEYLLPIYRQANSYPYLMDESIVGNPEEMGEDDLHHRAWEIVQPCFQKSQKEALSLYQQLRHSGRASHDLQEIVAASHNDRVDVLFVTSQLQKWGTFDPESNKVSVHQKMEPGDEDLLDLAAVQTLLHRGKVYVLRPEDMPDHSPVAALFRF